MSMKASELIHRYEQHFPLYLAEQGDPNGLAIGSLNQNINKVMVTLDVRPNVVEEAIEKNVDFIIAKHPPIFQPVARLTDEDPQTKMFLDLIKHNISVYASHTNMDIVPDGLNDWFCEALGIKETTYLSQTHEFSYEILTVMVPESHANLLREAMAQAGAGTDDCYTNTSFSTKGVGRFTPEVGSHPTIGEIGKSEVVEEEAITVLISPEVKSKVVQAMLQAHPYEVPAYYFTTLNNKTKTYGIGRIGNLEKPVDLEEMAKRLKSIFDLDHVRLIAKDPHKKVQRVAICGGTGQKFYTDAVAKGADLYITADVYYHTGHDMLETGMAVIDPGHYMEHYCKKIIVNKLNQWKQDLNWDAEFIASQADTNPFKAY